MSITERTVNVDDFQEALEAANMKFANGNIVLACHINDFRAFSEAVTQEKPKRTIKIEAYADFPENLGMCLWLEYMPPQYFDGYTGKRIRSKPVATLYVKGGE